MKYAFIAEHRRLFSIRAMCRCLCVLHKRERIRRKVYCTRDEARRDVFDYIEMFYNPTRKHARSGMPSPIEFERQHTASPEGV